MNDLLPSINSMSDGELEAFNDLQLLHWTKRELLLFQMVSILEEYGFRATLNDDDEHHHILDVIETIAKIARPPRSNRSQTPVEWGHYQKQHTAQTAAEKRGQ